PNAALPRPARQNCPTQNRAARGIAPAAAEPGRSPPAAASNQSCASHRAALRQNLSQASTHLTASPLYPSPVTDMNVPHPPSFGRPNYRYPLGIKRHWRVDRWVEENASAALTEVGRLGPASNGSARLGGRL